MADTLRAAADADFTAANALHHAAVDGDLVIALDPRGRVVAGPKVALGAEFAFPALLPKGRTEGGIARVPAGISAERISRSVTTASAPNSRSSSSASQTSSTSCS